MAEILDLVFLKDHALNFCRGIGLQTEVALRSYAHLSRQQKEASYRPGCARKIASPRAIRIIRRRRQHELNLIGSVQDSAFRGNEERHGWNFPVAGLFDYAFVNA